MRVLLDSHTLLWWMLGEASLSRTARETISDGGNEIIVSAASAWELAIKFNAGKLPRAADLVTNFLSEVEQEGFQLLPISVGHGIRAGLLPAVHKDPFDRMLIAQAQMENIPMMSNDRVFESYGVRRLW